MMLDDGPTSANGITPRLESEELLPLSRFSVCSPDTTGGWSPNFSAGVINCGRSNSIFIVIVLFALNATEEVPLFQRRRLVK